MEIDIKEAAAIAGGMIVTVGGFFTGAAGVVWKFLKSGIEESEKRVMERLDGEASKIEALDSSVKIKFADFDDELNRHRDAAERSRTRIHERLDSLSMTAATKQDLHALRDDIRTMLQMRPPAA